jgi:hypothetical protein
MFCNFKRFRAPECVLFRINEIAKASEGRKKRLLPRANPIAADTHTGLKKCAGIFCCSCSFLRHHCSFLYVNTHIRIRSVPVLSQSSHRNNGFPLLVCATTKAGSFCLLRELEQRKSTDCIGAVAANGGSVPTLQSSSRHDHCQRVVG